jgi:hypothetical protein
MHLLEHKQLKLEKLLTTQVGLLQQTKQEHDDTSKKISTIETSITKWRHLIQIKQDQKKDLLERRTPSTTPTSDVGPPPPRQVFTQQGQVTKPVLGRQASQDGRNKYLGGQICRQQPTALTDNFTHLRLRRRLDSPTFSLAETHHASQRTLQQTLNPGTLAPLQLSRTLGPCTPSLTDTDIHSHIPHHTHTLGTTHSPTAPSHTSPGALASLPTLNTSQPCTPSKPINQPTNSTSPLLG